MYCDDPAWFPFLVPAAYNAEQQHDPTTPRRHAHALVVCRGEWPWHHAFQGRGRLRVCKSAARCLHGPECSEVVPTVAQACRRALQCRWCRPRRDRPGCHAPGVQHRHRCFTCSDLFCRSASGFRCHTLPHGPHGGPVLDAWEALPVRMSLRQPIAGSSSGVSVRAHPTTEQFNQFIQIIWCMAGNAVWDFAVGGGHPLHTADLLWRRERHKKSQLLS